MENSQPFAATQEKSKKPSFSVNNITTAFLVFEVWAALMRAKASGGQFGWKSDEIRVD